MKILILCTRNSCRSQMAEGFLNSYDNKISAFSAGTNPSDKVHPKAIQEIVSENKIEASIEKIKDINLFAELGIFMTPGLIINDRVISSSKLPGKSLLAQWITEADK